MITAAAAEDLPLRLCARPRRTPPPRLPARAQDAMPHVPGGFAALLVLDRVASPSGVGSSAAHYGCSSAWLRAPAGKKLVKVAHPLHPLSWGSGTDVNANLVLDRRSASVLYIRAMFVQAEHYPFSASSHSARFSSQRQITTSRRAHGPCRWLAKPSCVVDTFGNVISKSYRCVFNTSSRVRRSGRYR
jgi:hypothetical protein